MSDFSKIELPVERVNTLESLHKQIREMITLLGRNTLKSTERFIMKYAEPDDLAEAIEEQEGFRKLAKFFHEARRESALKALKMLATIKPKIDKDRRLYTFKLLGNKEHDKIEFLWDDKTKQFYLKN